MGYGRIPDLAVVTNIAPTATSEQLRTLLSVGTIREFVVYPTNDPSQIVTRVCYVRYTDPINVCVAEHLTNTVFIDRAIMVKPVPDGRIPDEAMALKLANEGHSQNSSNSGVVSQVANVNGTQSITTIDPRLNALGLPQYPALPANLDPAKIEEIRRTVSASNISQYSTPEQILEFFNQFGEVKYLRMTSNETDLIKSALIEFTDQSSVANALQSTGINLNGSLISISHSTSGILKPHHNINHGNGNDNIKAQDTKSRSKESPVTSRRSRSQSRRSRSPHRSKRRSITPSPPRDRRRRSRSRERRRSIERKRTPSPVYGKDRSRDRRVRERSKERDRSRRSPERIRDRGRRSPERIRERSRRSPERTRDRERSRRDHSRERRSKERERERSRRKERERSRESERKTGDSKSRRRDKDRRSSRSRSRSKSPSVKRANDLPEDRMSVEMDIDENKIKMEPDSLSAKSEEGSPPSKFSTAWIAAGGSP